MPNWLDQLKGETQTRLLALLRRESLSVTSLAERLGLSDNAVRTHLAALERDGLVELAGVLRDTGGKPARLYTLTREGEELFPKAYSVVLGMLTEEITRRYGREQAIELLQSVGRRVASPAPEEDLDRRVASAAAALRSLGGEIQISPADGDWLLRGDGCPLSAVTTEHPEVCQLARALVEEITGHPTEECCDRAGRPRCGFRVKRSA